MKKEQWFSVERAKILWLIKKKPLTIQDIQKSMGKGRTTIYHHLNHLKKNGLIVETKDKKKAGQPVYITTNKAAPINWDLVDKVAAIFFK